MRDRVPQVHSVFYGYPAELIAQWCGVSVATARAYKDGIRKPSRQALRLFSLYRSERVLGDEWRGWIIRDGTITDPAGNATTLRQLESYALILQWVAAVAARSPDTQEQFYAFLRLRIPAKLTGCSAGT